MATDIAVIDLSSFPSGSSTERSLLARQVRDANRNVGFFSVVGHGVADSVIDAARRAASSFFDLPVDARMTVAMPEPGYPYGYSPMAAEALNRSIGGAARPDLKETYNIGPIGPPPRPVAQMDDPDERAVFAANLWPDEVLPGFRPAIEAYYDAMAELSGRLLEVFAIALDLDSEWFAPFIDAHGSALRLARYPALTVQPDNGQFRAGAHTDYGTLTVLALDGEAGLQVETADGRWVDVAHVDGALVVNLGDLMQRWTNDRWRSTMHRVVADAPCDDRLTMPFFHNANWDAVVEPITGSGESPRYEAITAGRHLMDKFRSTIV
jgi:isopenicillin N synthase-like dioxygenase